MGQLPCCNLSANLFSVGEAQVKLASLKICRNAAEICKSGQFFVRPLTHFLQIGSIIGTCKLALFVLHVRLIHCAKRFLKDFDPEQDHCY